MVVLLEEQRHRNNIGVYHGTEDFHDCTGKHPVRRAVNASGLLSWLGDQVQRGEGQEEAVGQA